jgi:hypothetical protein
MLSQTFRFLSKHERKTPGCPEDLAASVVEPLDVIVRRRIEATLPVMHGRIEGPHGAPRPAPDQS